MIGRATHSLRRAAPRRLLASPGWFLLVATSVALLAAPVSAPVLFLRAASDAALREELRAVDQDAFASTSSGLRGSWTGVMPADDQRTVLRSLDRLPGFGRPRVSALAAAASVGGRGVRAVVVVGDRIEGSTLEPTGHQDDDHVEQVLTAVRSAAGGGTAVLVASHDERVLDAADRGVRLDQGRLV